MSEQKPARSKEKARTAREEQDRATWEIIRRLMKDKGWILQELIRRSGITRTTFFNIQHGKSKGSYETFVKIAKAFGVDVDVILARTPYPEGIREGGPWTANLPESQKSVRVGPVSYIRVPVVKSVKHDEPPDTPENIVESMFLASGSASPDDFFLIVDDDAMAPAVQKGDTVHVRRNAVVKSGDVVCMAPTDGTAGLVRQYRPSGEAHEFSAPNGTPKTMKKKEREFILYGKIVQVIRSL